MFLVWGEGRGVSRASWPEAWLRWSAHPLGGVCRAHAQYPAFAPDTQFLLPALQKWQLGFLFLAFLYLIVRNLPRLGLHAVIFPPLQFLYDLLLEETFVQVQALQQRVPGPSLSQKEVGLAEARNLDGRKHSWEAV